VRCGLGVRLRGRERQRLPAMTLTDAVKEYMDGNTNHEPHQTIIYACIATIGGSKSALIHRYLIQYTPFIFKYKMFYFCKANISIYLFSI
jgi:hypothetical protein